MSKRHIFFEILLSDTRPTRLITVPLMLMAAAGFYAQSGHPPYDDMELLIDFMPWWVWTLAFTLMAVARFAGLFWMTKNRWLLLIIPTIGILLWSFLFAGSVVDLNMDDMGLLYTVPMLVETWILTRAMMEARL